MPQEKKFNQQLALLRVCNEHCIGILKGRFQSLQGLQKDLSSAGTMQRITQRISACVILHNFLLDDASPNVYLPELVNKAYVEENAPRQGQRSGGALLQDMVFEDVINYLIS
jgi:hypothetical protein